MTSPIQQLVVGIIVLMSAITLLQIIKFKVGIRGKGAAPLNDWHDDHRTQALLRDVRDLQQRVRTLERITVEKENSLAREIEDLRHK